MEYFDEGGQSRQEEGVEWVRTEYARGYQNTLLAILGSQSDKARGEFWDNKAKEYSNCLADYLY